MASFTLPPLQEADNLWGPPLPASTAPRADDASDTALAAAASSSLVIRDAAAAVLPDEFRDIPFAPYTKSEKIGRIADWNAGYAGGDSGSVTNVRTRAAQRGRDTAQAFGVGAGSAFAYFHGEDEASFSVVDNTKSAGAKRGGAGGLSALGRGRGRGGSRATTATRSVANVARPGAPQRAAPGRNLPSRGGAAAARVGRRPGWKDWDKPQRTREASVTVGSDWEQLEEIDFTRLGKLRLEVGDAKDLSSYGTLYEYDRSYDRITSVRFEKPLQPLDRVRYNPTTSDDPILQELASKPAAAGNAPRTRIFLTDSILALLMTATRSVYPWDIIITRDASGNIFMDKRDGGAFDFVTVNENAVDPPMDASEVAEKEGPAAAAAAAAKADKASQINTPGNLSLEATYINQNFAFQVVNEKKRSQLPSGANPFYDASTESEQLASCGYRYRQFDLSTSEEDAVELVVRTEVDAVLPSASKGAAPQYITIKTLNEFDSKAQGAGGAPEWRSKLDAQRGAVIATEMKNNAAKLARFAVQSLLAGAESMKMGYISRANARDASRHVILGTQWYKPRDFAAQINVNLSNGWGIVRTVADLARKAKKDEAEAKFVLAKDPNKPVVRFYSVPLTWPQDEEGDEDEEGEGELEDEGDE